MKKFVILLLLIISCTQRVHATADFDTDFRSTYVLQSDNNTQVTHAIKITNKLAHIYLKKYNISLGTDRINHLLVTAGGSKVPVKTSVEEFATDLEITLTQPVIGQDQTLELVISYDTPSVAISYGNVLELNIPRLSRANEAVYYSREIRLPSSYGQPQIATPKASHLSTNVEGDTILTYIGFPNDSITLLFGEKLDFQLNLTYHINNPTLVTANTEIAIPPDTEYQRVLLDSLDPPPSQIKQDQDQNWLAIYSLKGGESSTVHSRLFISVYPEPHYISPAIGEQSDLTRPLKYWDTQSDSIVTLSKKLTTPKLIYDYVVDKLTYDYAKVGASSDRLGGARSLDNPTSAICTEFTDTFITLARATGIPSREINGVAYMGNNSLYKPSNVEDYLHAWPEYYDQTSSHWVQVDPTLGKTTGGIDYFSKMDYGHITFVRHGQESTYPYPAGSYKTDAQEKTIDLSLATSLPDDNLQVSVTKNNGGYLVKNTGNIALRDYQLSLPDGQKSTIKYLPPLAEMDLKNNSQSSASIPIRAWNWLRTLLTGLFRLHS